MKNKQNIMLCCFYILDVSLGRETVFNMEPCIPLASEYADGIYRLHFLPKDVFLTEYSLGNRNRYKLFISHS